MATKKKKPKSVMPENGWPPGAIPHFDDDGNRITQAVAARLRRDHKNAERSTLAKELNERLAAAVSKSTPEAVKAEKE